MMITKLGMMAGLVALASAVSGCAMDATGEGEAETENASSENVGTKQSAVLSACASYDTATYDGCVESTDSSGYVHTRIYQCKPSAVSRNPYGVCFVESNYVLVGGGLATGGGVGFGTIIKATFPGYTQPGSYWFTSTTDHYYSDPHYLVPYAIGLRLDRDVNGRKEPWAASSLAKTMKITSVSSAGGQHSPAAVAIIPNQHLLLSGGANVPSSGQLLTHSFPAGSTAWAALSKDQIVSAPGSVTAFAVSIMQCPTGLNYCLQATSSVGYGPSGTGSQSALRFGNTGYATTGVGATANSTTSYSLTSGRLLTSIAPVGENTVSWSKDYGYVDPGNTSAYWLGLKRQ